MQPVILKEEAMNDPRFRYFPELEEEKFQSTMTVPITSKDRSLIGVITMQAVAPYEFTEQPRSSLVILPHWSLLPSRMPSFTRTPSANSVS